MSFSFFTLIIVLVLIAALMLMLARLYTRASKEISFVRTGFRGQKVIMNGGAIVLPILHETIPVNMNTLRLEVRRSNEAALITKDRMRVDVLAEFYVRVQPTTESIANAAQTLGKRTMQPESLKELVEGKFVDALRAVAAEMAMEELHEQRVEFVQKVQAAVSEDLLKNGLELESVSLTGLDQTNKEFFNPQNAFDAEGLTKLTQEIEERRKKRNDIEQDTEVQINRKNLEAEQEKLQIARDEEYARLAQEREVAVRKASQTAEIAKEEADRAREAEQARISADQQVKEAAIDADKSVKEREIVMQQTIRQRDIERERAVEVSDIDRLKQVELTNQDKAIAVAEKSKEQSEADAAADAARAIAVKAEEQVRTVRETEVAERAKAVELVNARQEAEQEAISITVAAEAEKQAADDQAEAVRTLAQAAADKLRITAEGDSQAVRLKASADEEQYRVDAAGQQAINSAANVLSAEQIAMQVRLALIQALPQIIEQSVKPMDNIDGIKIFQVEGLGGSNGVANGGDGDGAGVGATGGGGSLADQVVNSALRYRGQAPLLDGLLKEIGLEGSDINGMTNGLRNGLHIVDEKPGGEAAE